MRKILLILVATLFLAQFASIAALAADPIAGCPKGFDLMMIMDDPHDPMHQHIGSLADQNGDGWVCMRHISDTLHLHIDNTVPVP